MAKEPNWLHVYPADAWHGAVTIVGSAAALRALAEKLASAAESGAAVVSGCANDGEGYWVEIVRVNDLDKRQDIPLHYINALASDDEEMPEDIVARIRAAHRERER